MGDAFEKCSKGKPYLDTLGYVHVALGCFLGWVTMIENVMIGKCWLKKKLLIWWNGLRDLLLTLFSKDLHPRLKDLLSFPKLFKTSEKLLLVRNVMEMLGQIMLLYDELFEKNKVKYVDLVSFCSCHSLFNFLLSFFFIGCPRFYIKFQICTYPVYILATWIWRSKFATNFSRGN